GVSPAEEINVSLLFQHDVLDNLHPFEVELERVKQLVGGMARMFTAVENERKENPDAFLVDAGDYSMGTLFQTIFTPHTPMMQIMGQKIGRASCRERVKI